MEKKRHKVVINTPGHLHDDCEAIREYYGEPVAKILAPDMILAIKKHIERIKSEPKYILGEKR